MKIRKFYQNFVRPTIKLGAVALGLFACTNDDKNFPIQGELIRDGVYSVGPYDFYGVIINLDGRGMATYPILGSIEELRELDERFTSREESGTKGDRIGINPKTNIFSLDGIVLPARNLKKLD